MTITADQGSSWVTVRVSADDPLTAKYAANSEIYAYRVTTKSHVTGQTRAAVRKLDHSIAAVANQMAKPNRTVAQQATALALIQQLHARRNRIEVDGELTGDGVALFSAAGKGKLQGAPMLASMLIGLVLGGLIGCGISGIPSTRSRHAGSGNRGRRLTRHLLPSTGSVGGPLRRSRGQNPSFNPDGAGHEPTDQTAFRVARNRPLSARLAIFAPSMAGGGAERSASSSRGLSRGGDSASISFRRRRKALASVGSDRGSRVVDLGARRVAGSLPALVRYLHRRRASGARVRPRPRECRRPLGARTGRILRSGSRGRAQHTFGRGCSEH